MKDDSYRHYEINGVSFNLLGALEY